jgi:hypothetical protein
VEVGAIAAMVSCRPGTAPRCRTSGPDGLPLIYFKRFEDLLLPIFACVWCWWQHRPGAPPNVLMGQ